MKFIHADNPIEWLAFKTNLVPMPMVHGYMFDLISKTVTAASRLEVFEESKTPPKPWSRLR